MSNEQIVKEIFTDMLGLEEIDITNDASNNDLQMDSLDKVDVVQSIEQRFGIDINDKEFDGLKQFSDYVNIVNEKAK